MKSDLGGGNDIILENRGLGEMFERFVNYNVDEWVVELMNSSLGVIQTLSNLNFNTLAQPYRVDWVLSSSSYATPESDEELVDRNMLMTIASLPIEALEKLYQALEQVNYAIQR